MTSTINVLSPLQQMRLRPGMYIGDTDHPDTLAKELIDNAIDELVNDYVTRIDIAMDPKEGWIRVRDNGRGLPLTAFNTNNPDMSNLNGAIQARLLFTQAFSSGKYDKANYKYSGGLHGVGIKACNVFSTKTMARVMDKANVHNGEMYTLELGWNGHDQTFTEDWIDPKTLNEDLWWSTEVTIWPDMKVFRSPKARIREMQLQLAKSMKPNTQIFVNGEEVKPFSFKQSVTPDLLSDKLFSFKTTIGLTQFEVMFGWSSKDFNTFSRGAVNIGSCNDGWHIKEARLAIGRVVGTFDELLTNSDADYGLRMFVSALVSEPSFTSQTKEKLAWPGDIARFNEELARRKYPNLIETITDDRTGEQRENLHPALDAVKNDPEFLTSQKIGQELEKQVKKQLASDETFTNLLVKRIVEYKKSVQKLSDQNYINSIVKTGNHKITRNAVAGIRECTSSDRTKCELYICEGKSAEGNLLQKRDRATQAIFPLRGKPLNVANVNDIKEILKNREMVTMVNGIGTGIHPNVNMADARYGKIIIVCDADADGRNIEALVIGALAFLNPKVIESGMLYVVDAPLYKQDNKFIYEEAGLNKKKDYDRFKGLGSMTPEDSDITLMNPKTRKLRKVTLTEAREKVLSIITDSSEKKRIMIANKYLVE